MPKVSVIVPVYNVEPYLSKCIDSILEQQYESWELILIDDGSPDRCGEIIDQYAKRDSRIVAIHQENKGVSAARNTGLARAAGKYISFVDPDDYISEMFLEKLVLKMEQEDADIACCNWNSFSDEETFVHEVKNVPSIMTCEEWLCHIFDSPRSIGGSNWNKLFRRSLIQQHYQEGLRICEDNLFLCQYSVNIIKAVFVNEALYHIYERTDSTIRANRAKLVDGLFARKKMIDVVAVSGSFPRKLAEKDYLDTCFSYYTELKRENVPKSMESKRHLKKYIYRHLLHVLRNEQIFWKTKIMYFLF